ncbi:hypothetical protein D3C72_1745200 [compost metagenome]
MARQHLDARLAKLEHLGDPLVQPPALAHEHALVGHLLNQPLREAKPSVRRALQHVARHEVLNGRRDLGGTHDLGEQGGIEAAAQGGSRLDHLADRPRQLVQPRCEDGVDAGGQDVALLGQGRPASGLAFERP